MTARAYYNEHDAFCAQWLGNLIAAGHIMAGDVDERDIRDVQPDDVRGYTRCHFFGGIAGWDLALRLAGWPEDREVWTGSCPCQPFSSAGAQQGTDDSRHLWPAWFRLIRECRPSVIFGEQVASAIGHGWLDLVFDDLEREGYACGAAVLPACSVGAPHLRQRLWFVADARSEQRFWWTNQQRPVSASSPERYKEGAHGERSGTTGGLDDPASARQQSEGRGPEGETRHSPRLCGPERGCSVSELADADGALASDRGLQRGGRLLQSAEDAATGELADAERARRAERWAIAGNGSLASSSMGDVLGERLQERERDGRLQREAVESSEGQAIECGGNPCIMADTMCERGQQDARGAPTDEAPDGRAGRDGGEPNSNHVAASDGKNFWWPCDWLPCRDGKARPTQPGTFPLAHGIPGRLGRLRAYGNAIVPQVAAEFVKAYIEAR